MMDEKDFKIIFNKMQEISCKYPLTTGYPRELLESTNPKTFNAGMHFGMLEFGSELIRFMNTIKDSK